MIVLVHLDEVVFVAIIVALVRGEGQGETSIN
jgi:hypothetical protein